MDDISADARDPADIPSACSLHVLKEDNNLLSDISLIYLLGSVMGVEKFLHRLSYCYKFLRKGKALNPSAELLPMRKPVVFPLEVYPAECLV